jgi:hypothetical protein
MASLGFLGFIIFLIVGIAQFYLGFLGIEHHFGELAAWIALGLAFFLRLMLPLTIATYFGAVDVMGWAWYEGLLIAAPGLLFIMPAMISAVIGAVFNKPTNSN